MLKAVRLRTIMQGVPFHAFKEYMTHDFIYRTSSKAKLRGVEQSAQYENVSSTTQLKFVTV